MKIKVKYIVILFIVSVTFTALTYASNYADTSNIGLLKKRPIGLNINLLGPTLLTSLSVDYFIVPFLNVEAGAGFFGYFAGLKYNCIYGPFTYGISPYCGVLYSKVIPLFYEEKYYYIPIGLQYIDKNGFGISTEAAYRTNKRFRNNAFYFSVKLNYHFSK